MRESCGKKRKTLRYSPQSLAAWLRRVEPAKTAAAVAAAIGAPERTVEAWLGGEASPSLGWALALVGAYGPAALAAMFETPPGWLDDAARAARRAELEAAMAELARQRAEM